MKNLVRLIRDEDGQTMVEYGLLIAFIAIATLVVLMVLGPRIAGYFQSVDDTLANNPPPAAAT